MRLLWNKDKNWIPELPHYVGGQIQIERRVKDPVPADVKIEVQRGKIENIKIKENGFGAVVYLPWLCDLRYLFDGNDTRQPRWVLRRPTLGGFFRIDLTVSRYYLQPDEDRIKLKSMAGEVCHFYLPHDYTNLIDSGSEDELIHYCSTPVRKLTFKKLMVAVYLKENPHLLKR
jgi:hypothetical protein